MSDQKYFLITKENAEVIINKVRRLSWDDANEVMAIIKDLRAVSVKETEEDLLLQKKFWDIFENNLQKLSFQNYKNSKPMSFFNLMYLIPKRAKYSASFLRNNQAWIK